MQEFNEKPDIPDFYGESADGAYGESKSQPPVVRQYERYIFQHERPYCGI